MMKRKKLFRYYRVDSTSFCLLRRFAGAKAGRNDGNGSYHDTDPGER